MKIWYSISILEDSQKFQPKKEKRKRLVPEIIEKWAMIINKNKINGTKQLKASGYEWDWAGSGVHRRRGRDKADGQACVGVGLTHTHSAVLQSPIPCLAIAAGDPCSLHPSFLFNVHILIHTTLIIFHQTKQWKQFWLNWK